MEDKLLISLILSKFGRKFNGVLLLIYRVFLIEVLF